MFVHVLHLCVQAVALCPSVSTYATVCVCLSPSLSHPPSIPLSLHHFLSVWVSMQSDPGELITVGAWVAGTKTLHRQHNSGSRNQTGSTQSSLTGPAQISSAQPSHTHRTTNTRPAFRSAGLKAAIMMISTANIWYISFNMCCYRAFWIYACRKMPA